MRQIDKRSKDLMNDYDRKVLLGFLSEFASQPFIKTKMVTPDLLTKVLANDGVYLYWVNSSLCK